MKKIKLNQKLNLNKQVITSLSDIKGGADAQRNSKRTSKLMLCETTYETYCVCPTVTLYTWTVETGTVVSKTTDG